MNEHTAELLSEMGYEPLIIEPTAVPRAQNAAIAVAESGDTTWDLVVLGDSLLADDYSVLPEAYAARIEKDLGFEAEVILISVGGGDLHRMEKRFFAGECGGADNQDRLRQQLEESQANWDALLAEIASLADPKANPDLQELAGTGDGVHVSNEGDAVIADLLRGLGYGFVKP